MASGFNRPSGLTCENDGEVARIVAIAISEPRTKPKRQEKAIDPDNPFAALAALKGK